MRYRNVPVMALFLGLALFVLCETHSLDAKSTSKNTPIADYNASEFEIIRAAADSWISSGKQINISTKELFSRLTDGKPGNVPFILSVREVTELPDVYTKGHIFGAVNIPWRVVFKKNNLSKLPKDMQIVVYSYNGHIGGQVSALLNILGYDAMNLKWGMTSWTPDKEVAPGRYDESRDCKAYRIETNINEPTERPGLLIQENSIYQDKFEIIRAAADSWLSSCKPPNISSGNLFNKLNDTKLHNIPFILSVREINDYTKGHIFGAVNIPWRVVFKKNNLSKLPKDKQIVVYGNNGQTASQVTALLNALGYKAINLLWGITSWTFNKNIAPDRYSESEDCMDYYFVQGARPAPEVPF